jgi:DnaJ-domain-containing protein 1
VESPLFGIYSIYGKKSACENDPRNRFSNPDFQLAACKKKKVVERTRQIWCKRKYRKKKKNVGQNKRSNKHLIVKIK